LLHGVMGWIGIAGTISEWIGGAQRCPNLTETEVHVACPNGVAVAGQDFAEGEVVLRSAAEHETEEALVAGWDADQRAVAAVSLDGTYPPSPLAAFPGLRSILEITATASAANVRLLDMENGTVLQTARGVARGEQLSWEAPPEHAMLQLARYGLHAPPSTGLAPWWQMSRDEQLRIYGNQVHILDSLECSSRLVSSRVGEFAEECRAELLQLLNPSLSATERMRRVYAHYAYLCAGKLRRYKKVEDAIDRLRSSNQSLSSRILGAADEEIEAYTACQDHYTRKLAGLPSVLAPTPPSGEGWIPSHGRKSRYR
jgi:hypothetical protein